MAAIRDRDDAGHGIAPPHLRGRLRRQDVGEGAAEDQGGNAGRFYLLRLALGVRLAKMTQRLRLVLKRRALNRKGRW